MLARNVFVCTRFVNSTAYSYKACIYIHVRRALLDRFGKNDIPGGEAVKPLDSMLSFDPPAPAEPTDGEGSVAAAG